MMNIEDGQLTIESIVAQIATLSTMTTWILGAIITILIAMVIGMGILWREGGIHEQALMDIQEVLRTRSNYESRISSLESNRFTISDSRQLSNELGVKVDMLRSDLASIKEDIAVLKYGSRPK